jgi:flagellar motility protein MotE (MotC chaperone)
MKKGMQRGIFAAALVFFLSGGGIFLLNAADLPVAISPEEIEKSISLQQREEAVAAREKELDRRQQELDAVQKELDGRLEQITALQKDVEAKLAAIRQEQDTSFKNLIKVYSSMSASKIAPLLNQMTDDNVAQVLRAMKPEQVGQIMPKLDSEKAVRVSKLLGRFE